MDEKQRMEAWALHRSDQSIAQASDQAEKDIDETAEKFGIPNDMVQTEARNFLRYIWYCGYEAGMNSSFDDATAALIRILDT